MTKILFKEDLEHISEMLGWSEDSLRGKSFFITGATGFIGSWILEFLIFLNEEKNLGMSFVVTTRNADNFKKNFPHLQAAENVTTVETDIRELKTDMCPGEVNYIIHAATDASVELNASQPLNMAETITFGTKNVLELAKAKKIQNLLFLSSGAVYGKQPDELETVAEDYVGAPDCSNALSAYGEAKRYAELQCAIYGKEFQVPYVTARCFAFVGARLSLDGSYAIGNFIGDVIAGKDICISGDGETVRSYMYSADLVVWLLTMLLKGKAGETYNVGSDKACTIKELAEEVLQVGASEGKIEIKNKNPGGKSVYVPNVDKARKDFGLEINHDLNQAIAKTIKWQKS